MAKPDNFEKSQYSKLTSTPLCLEVHVSGYCFVVFGNIQVAGMLGTICLRGFLQIVFESNYSREVKFSAFAELVLAKLDK